MKMFETLVMSDLKKNARNNRRIKFNLSKEENTAIRNLERDESVVIKPADKGGGVVILKKSCYIAEVMKILNDGMTYKEIKENPVNTIKDLLNIYLNKGREKGILLEKEYQYLYNLYPKTPTFYLLPKIHKNRTEPPGRPIVAGINSITSNLSEYVDKILQPIVKKIRSYTKDTMDMLQKLKEAYWDRDCILVVCDVNALYSNIPHIKGVEIVKEQLCLSKDLEDEQVDFVMEGIQFILENNYFQFEEKFYLQTRGTAMGTRFAPSYANLYMAGWETSFVYGSRDWALGRVPIYKRYIDDVFFIWKGEEGDLIKFLDQLDNSDWGIKLEKKWSRDIIAFLDLEIYVKENKLHTRTFFKDVDANTFIDKTSCHNDIWLKGVPKGQLTRIRRNCSEIKEFEQQAESLKTNFIDKGYDEYELDNLIKELKDVDQERLIKYKIREDTPQDVPFICEFNNDDQLIKKTFKKYWHILKKDKDLGSILGDKPRIIFRGARNIKTKLVRSKFERKKVVPNHFNLKEGFYQCGQCLACRSTGNTKTLSENFLNKKIGKEVKIKGILTCCTKNVIYLLECPCGLQYVGRTSRALNIRISEHVRNIRNQYEKHSVSQHFKLAHNSCPKDLKFKAIKRVKSTNKGMSETTVLGREEMKLIFDLGTMAPIGLNNDFELIHFL
uniref:Reverse transcriptase domain-containing protein n=1 Tax=Leptobrachium leishanense TaxID=445787 RepID=A0A8C5WDY6_9ANUR